MLLDIAVFLSSCLIVKAGLLTYPVPLHYNQTDVVYVNQKATGALPWFFDRGAKCESTKTST